MDLQQRMTRFAKGDLYVVITESCCAGRTSLEVLEACLKAGVKIVQLREKHLSGKNLVLLATKWRELTAAYGALFVVNDRVDIALASRADGVHLGQDDMPIQIARELAPELIIGASTHSVDEAKSAERDGASYINIGPIYPTPTKSIATGSLGPEAIREISQHVTIPFTCMGGIKMNNICDVLEQGAQIVAVVTAVTEAHDIEDAALALRNKIVYYRNR